MNKFTPKSIFFLVFALLASNFLFAQPTMDGIEKSLPDEKHPFAFEKDEAVFHSKENPFVKRLLALNAGLEHTGNIPNPGRSSLHKLSFNGKTYLFKNAFLGDNTLQLTQRLREVVGLPHVMNIYGMKSLKYDDSDGFHLVQLMEFLPGHNLKKEQEILEQSCPNDLENRLLLLVSQLHSTVIELSTMDLYCGQEEPSNYVFDRDILKRVDVAADCDFLHGRAPELDIKWLKWAQQILQHCRRNASRVDSIIKLYNETHSIRNYQDLNNAILRVL